MKKILYAAQFYEPEPIMKGQAFAKALSLDGDEVTVITGLPNYPIGKFYDGYGWRSVGTEDIDGITIKRLPLIPAHGRNAIKRALNYISFFVSLLIWALFNLKKYDAIYIYHPPMTVGIAIMMAAKIHRKPYIIDIQDLWPESVVFSGIDGTGKLTKILSAMCEKVYKNAAHIVGQSHGMRHKVIERGGDAAHSSVIFNWSHHEIAQPLYLNRSQDEYFNIYYTGNLGVYQSLETLIEAAKIACKSEPKIRIYLVGNGSEQDNLKKMASGLDDGIVNFIPNMTLPELMDELKNADALVLNLRSEAFFEFTIPSKLQFYLSMGLPIVAGIGGEAKAILEESKAAIVVRQGSAEDMANAFVKLAKQTKSETDAMAANGFNFYCENLSFNQAIEKTKVVIDKVL